MATNLPPEMILERERQRLEKLESIHETRTGQWKKQLAGANDWMKPRIQAEFDAWRIKSESDIDQARFLVEQYEQQIKQTETERRQRARAELDNRKADALQAWLDNGGTAEGFQEAWPQMERDILIKRTTEALE